MMLMQFLAFRTMENLFLEVCFRVERNYPTPLDHWIAVGHAMHEITFTYYPDVGYS